MANYANLKSAIQQVVKTNGNNEITGALLQQSLLAMINSLGGYYQFAGIATPSTNPGTPDQNVFYLASTAGTYSNFGSIVIEENEAAILKYNGTWSKDSSGFATSEKVNQLEHQVTGLDLNFSDTIKQKFFPLPYTLPNGAKVLVTLLNDLSEDGVRVSVIFYNSSNQATTPEIIFTQIGETKEITLTGDSTQFYYYNNRTAAAVSFRLRYGGMVQDIAEISQEISELNTKVDNNIVTISENTELGGYDLSVGEDTIFVNAYNINSDNSIGFLLKGYAAGYADGILRVNNDYDLCICRVKPNTQYLISGGAYVIRCFYNDVPSSDSFISGTINGNTLITTPQNCKYLILDFQKSAAVEYQNVKIEEYIYYDTPKNESFVYDSKLDKDGNLPHIFEQYVYNVAGNKVANANYDCCVFRCKPNSTYRIVNANVAIAIFYNGFPSSTTLIGTATAPTLINTPNNCVYVALDFNRSDAIDYKNVEIVNENEETIDTFIGTVRKNIISSVKPFIKSYYAYTLNATGGAADSRFDAIVQPVSVGEYEVIGNTPYLVLFYNDIPSSQSYIGKYLVSERKFFVPTGVKYLAIDFLHTDIDNYGEVAIIKLTDWEVESQVQNINGVSKTYKPLTKICFVGDSLTANEIGGAVPNEEAVGERPMRLLSNNFPRKFYDQISWNKPKWRRLDHSDWSKSGFTEFTESGLFDGTQEKYFKAESAGSYIEIDVPMGYDNFALIVRQNTGYGKLNVTINGNAPSSYTNPIITNTGMSVNYVNNLLENNTVVNTSVVPLTVLQGVSQIDLAMSANEKGNPYHIVQFNHLTASGVNKIRFTANSNERVDVWGGFYWMGKTVVCMNIAHGGHTMAALNEHLEDELYGEDYDSIIFELTAMNNCSGTIEQAESSTEAIVNRLKDRDIVFTTSSIFGLSIEHDTNFYQDYQNPTLKDVNEAMAAKVIDGGCKVIDIFRYFETLVIENGGSLNGGEAGLLFTWDGMHQNAIGCDLWFNYLFPRWISR